MSNQFYLDYSCSKLVHLRLVPCSRVGAGLYSLSCVCVCVCVCVYVFLIARMRACTSWFM